MDTDHVLASLVQARRMSMRRASRRSSATSPLMGATLSQLAVPPLSAGPTPPPSSPAAKAPPERAARVLLAPPTTERGTALAACGAVVAMLPVCLPSAVTGPLLAAACCLLLLLSLRLDAQVEALQAGEAQRAFVRALFRDEVEPRIRRMQELVLAMQRVVDGIEAFTLFQDSSSSEAACDTALEAAVAF